MTTVIGRALFAGGGVTQLSAYAADLGFSQGNSHGADPGAWQVTAGALFTVGNIFGTDHASFDGSIGSHDYLEYRAVGLMLPALNNTEAGLVGRDNAAGNGGVVVKLVRVSAGHVDAWIAAVKVATNVAIAHVDDGVGIDLVLTMIGDVFTLSWEPNGGGASTPLGTQTIAGFNVAGNTYGGLWKHYASSSGLTVVFSDLLMTQLNQPPTPPAAITTPIATNYPALFGIPVAWTAGTDPEGDALQYEGQWFDTVQSAWVALFPLQSGLTYAWVTAAIPNQVTHIRIRSWDGQYYSAYLQSVDFHIVTPVLSQVQMPTAVTVGVAITPTVQVDVRSADSTPLPGTAVTVRLGAHPVGAVLGGTLVRSTASPATFNDLTVSVAGSYTLIASTPAAVDLETSAFVAAAAIVSYDLRNYSTIQLPDWITKLHAVQAVLANGRKVRVVVKRMESKIRDFQQDLLDPTLVDVSAALIGPTAFLRYQDGLWFLDKQLDEGESPLWAQVTDLNLVVSGIPTVPAALADLSLTVPFPPSGLKCLSDYFALVLADRANLGDAWKQRQEARAMEARDRLLIRLTEFDSSEDLPFDPDVQ